MLFYTRSKTSGLLKKLIVLFGLMLGLGTSHISASFEKESVAFVRTKAGEIELNPQQCLFFGEVVLAIGADKETGMPQEEMNQFLDAMGIMEPYLSLTKNLAGIVYKDKSRDYQKLSGEFVAFCMKNQGRIPLVGSFSGL